MKKSKLFSGVFLCIGLSTSYLNAQNIFPSSGNVGIGTFSPSTNLHIVESASPSLKISSTIEGDGPWVELGVATCNDCFSRIAKKGDIVLRGASSSGINSNFLIINPSYKGNIVFGTGTWENIQKRMIIDHEGNVGIGTNSFMDGSEVYRLSVNGAIRAYRVKVYTDWADYVFEEDYELPTLEEVEDYIIRKGHLMDMPSAEEVEKNGIELGEMNKLLLQKIEELTLYLIEKDKQLKEIEQQVKLLLNKESSKK